MHTMSQASLAAQNRGWISRATRWIYFRGLSTEYYLLSTSSTTLDQIRLYVSPNSPLLRSSLCREPKDDSPLSMGNQ